jgi:hypothetical protein
MAPPVIFVGSYQVRAPFSGYGMNEATMQVDSDALRHACLGPLGFRPHQVVSSCQYLSRDFKRGRKDQRRTQ